MSHAECPECPSLHRDVARFRAEAERIQHINAELLKQKDGVDKDLFGAVCFERDEALARVKTLEATLNDIPCSGPAGCEALALVAVLLNKASQWISKGDSDTSGQCDCQFCRLVRSGNLDITAEARTLLDRLRRAEAVVKATKDFLADNQTAIEDHWWGGKRIRAALAEWEEGRRERRR